MCTRYSKVKSSEQLHATNKVAELNHSLLESWVWSIVAAPEGPIVELIGQKVGLVHFEIQVFSVYRFQVLSNCAELDFQIRVQNISSIYDLLHALVAALSLRMREVVTIHENWMSSLVCELWLYYMFVYIIGPLRESLGVFVDLLLPCVQSGPSVGQPKPWLLTWCVVP